jgi:hypothetical protein
MISQSLADVRQRIVEAAQQFNRSAISIQLLAVSKTYSVADILAAFQCGQHCFGESYLSEAISKIAALRDYAIEWHFIGPLQSNKTRLIAENFAWVQSLDRLKVAQRLQEQRPNYLPPLNVCIQVNVSNEPQKSGIAVEEAFAFASVLMKMPRLRLRGLMTIPMMCDDFEQQRLAFRRLRECFQQLQSAGLEMDTLSMGMTNDMVAAIAEGATMLRIGTAIFGKRVE